MNNKHLKTKNKQRTVFIILNYFKRRKKKYWANTNKRKQRTNGKCLSTSERRCESDMQYPPTIREYPQNTFTSIALLPFNLTAQKLLSTFATYLSLCLYNSLFLNTFLFFFNIKLYCLEKLYFFFLTATVTFTGPSCCSQITYFNFYFFFFCFEHLLHSISTVENKCQSFCSL